MKVLGFKILFLTFIALTFSDRAFSFPTIGPGISAGAIGDAAGEWVPAIGFNIDIEDSFNFRHIASGVQRGAYKIYATHSYANYLIPITSNKKTLRFRLGAGYMRKTTSVLDNEMRVKGELARTSTSSYVYLSNGLSARVSLGRVYAALDTDGFYYPNALLPFYRGYGFQFATALTLGVEF